MMLLFAVLAWLAWKEYCSTAGRTNAVAEGIA
jgi:hypothetical protein